MLGKLTSKQSEFILLSNYIGRIGCSVNNKPLIIPVTYVYNKKFIYGRSLDGVKIALMRKNPNVCFQVDVIDNLANWRSVLVQGKFEELKTEASEKIARDLFHERLLPITLGETVDPSRELAEPPHRVQKILKPITYRISVDEISGRFEKQVFQ